MTAYVPPYSASLLDWQRQVANAVNPLLQKSASYESILTYGAAGDGTTDDTKALTAFFNHAIANPGIPHLLDARTYAISAPLPTINVSNVWIEGAGAHIHDAGSPQISGTVFKYIGTSALSSSVITVSSVSGSSNQRIANIKLRGIGIDCNTGLVGYGATINSIRESDIDLLVLNAGTGGIALGVVASLAEDKNIQRCKFRLWLRQSEVSVPGITLSGDSVANVSMNEFWIDAVHKNAAVLVSSNSDNNLYRFFRSFMVGGGTATEAVSLQGGASSAVGARAEKFEFYTANKPIHVYGTGSYTVASTANTVYLDTANGTPVPTVDTGAQISWRSNYADFGTGSATSATAGTNGAVPAQVAGYMVVNVNGASVKVPYFNT